MLRDSFRLLVILNTLLKARLDKELSAFEKPKIISLLLLISPWRLYSSKGDSGERLRKALEDLGPIFIKFGQLLSTRPDVLPTEITSSLKTLQDDLPHFSETEALTLIEKELGSSIDILFEDFDLTPIAAASIAQVYSAKLKENQKPVAIKIVRPGIKKKIERDIETHLKKYEKDGIERYTTNIIGSSFNFISGSGSSSSNSNSNQFNDNMNQDTNVKSQETSSKDDFDDDIPF